MRFDIISVLPDLLTSPFAHSILQRAQKKGIAEIIVHNLRDYATNKQKSVDDYPYGGGSGMVMSIPPFSACIEKLQEERSYDEIIFMSPDGETLNQTIANELSIKGNIIILCGHYEGFDERIKSIIDLELSVGDFILTGGEIPSMLVTDCLTRLIPGVISSESLEDESFNNNLLDYPNYTKPYDFRGMKVPDVLISGHHENIRKYRLDEQIRITKEKRPDLIGGNYEK